MEDPVSRTSIDHMYPEEPFSRFYVSCFSINQLLENAYQEMDISLYEIILGGLRSGHIVRRSVKQATNIHISIHIDIVFEYQIKILPGTRRTNGCKSLAQNSYKVRSNQTLYEFCIFVKISIRSKILQT